ncbi:MAG: alpha/beta hydrolase-fold protein [Gammaproteobacteria bacterium]
MPSDEPPLIIETGAEPDASVIWLHGLGADGYDFEGLVPMLELPADAAVRFVLPHAPVQPVTVNNGMRMRAWYDILGFGAQFPQDEKKARGIAAGRMVLAGFSQGGAVALHTALRYPERLAGVMALSTYLPVSATLAGERSDANCDLPILMVHGTEDAVVPVALGEASRDKLEQQGYAPEWHTYPMPHTISADEIALIGDWLRRILGV